VERQTTHQNAPWKFGIDVFHLEGNHPSDQVLEQSLTHSNHHVGPVDGIVNRQYRRRFVAWYTQMARALLRCSYR
jgi:hypothetical protein